MSAYPVTTNGLSLDAVVNTAIKGSISIGEDVQEAILSPLQGDIMNFERMLAYTVAGYLIAVGLLFGLVSVFQFPYIHVEPSGTFLVLGISLVFAVSGVISFILLRKGKLKKEGGSIADVRQEAIEKLKDPELLSRIAIKESDSELAETARQRLREIKG